jgi:hydroxymethylglutaryl-CoA lyase
MNSFPKQVSIIEVGPRDGLQNEPLFVPTSVKIEFINLLSKTGLASIESGSFVSAKAIPQLADTEQVFSEIDKSPNISYPLLVPNEQGLERALSVNAKNIALFTSASEAFSLKNINCSIEESLVRFQKIINIAKKHKLKLRAYISCVLGCPYEGNIPPEKVANLCQKLFSMGITEISLGDTIGIGTAHQTQKLIKHVLKKIPIDALAMHFHNTYGQAIANIYASLEMGVYKFDSAVAGLGGCPYAKGATGNVATEDVLYLLQGLGIETGVDLMKIIHVSDFICKKLNRRNNSFVTNALIN